MDITIPSPKELDAQCPIVLAGWLDLGSSDWKERDDDPALTKKWANMLVESGMLKADSLGRLWGLGNEGRWFPYHIESNNRKYGIRISKKAAN